MLGLYVEKQRLLRKDHRGPRLNKYDQSIVFSSYYFCTVDALRQFIISYLHVA